MLIVVLFRFLIYVKLKLNYLKQIIYNEKINKILNLKCDLV